MSSVSDRAKMVKQPYGGYLKPSSCEKLVFDDKIVLNENENVQPSTLGLVVDYLFRFARGTDFNEAFKFPQIGALRAMKYNEDLICESEFYYLIDNITGLDDKSVSNACKLVSFDIWARNPNVAKGISGSVTRPDKDTIFNIQVMVKRCLAFFEKHGPIIQEGFRFDPVSERIVNKDGSVVYNLEPYHEMMATQKGSYGGYTPTVEAGEGDYLTADTLWDLKVLKSKITSQMTLQLLMYWVMGQHSGQIEFKGIRELGIFNPRSNTAFLYDVKKITSETIRVIENEILCYD